MNCQQVQHLLDDLRRDRLPAASATRLRQHLADCTDCRVQQQRTARLERLLTLTRYEQPPRGYFPGVATEFHRRQAALSLHHPWWTRAAETIVGHDTPAWRFALAGTAVLALAWSTYWIQTAGPADTTMAAAEASAVVALAGTETAVTFAVAPPTAGHWEPLIVALPDSPPFAAANAATPTPRYVLDRLPVVPASYDPARADF